MKITENFPGKKTRMRIEAIEAYLKDKNGTTADIAKALKIKRTAAFQYTRYMLDVGMIKSDFIKSTMNGDVQLYRLCPPNERPQNPIITISEDLDVMDRAVIQAKVPQDKWMVGHKPVSDPLVAALFGMAK